MLSNRVKFMSYINWKFLEEVHDEEQSNKQLAGIIFFTYYSISFFSFTKFLLKFFPGLLMFSPYY